MIQCRNCNALYTCIKIKWHYFLFQTAFVRQKTPHPKELKAKAHKLFGGKKGEQPEQNGENLANQDVDYNESNEIDEDKKEAFNGVGPPSVFFRDGVGNQPTSNGDYEDNGDVGDDENEEVLLIFNIS